MTKTDAIQFFGSQAACAAALGISPSAVSMWPERLPALRQFQIQHASHYALAVDPEHLPPFSMPTNTEAA